MSKRRHRTPKATKATVDPGTANPLVPFPGNVNTMDPDGLDSLLWTDVGQSLGIDLRQQIKAMGRIDAMGLVIAMQCADVQAQDLANSDMTLWRETSADQYQKVRSGEHWFARMLTRKPNEFHTWIEFWRMIGLHLALAQNAYIVKEITRAGEVVGLIPVSPGRARERIGRNNRLYYEFQINTEFERAQFDLDEDDQGSSVILPADRVIHLKGRMWNGLRGISNLESGKPLFRLLNSIADYQENLFGNNGTVLLTFETNEAFQAGDQGEIAFQRLKRQLTDRVRKGVQSGDPILLENGLTAKQITINAREAMTAEAFTALVTRVCGQMKTPPHKIHAMETVKYENMASADNQYASAVMIPMARNIEEGFRFGLLTDDELDDLFPEFDRMALMAGDMKTLSDVIDVSVKNGVMKINEARQRLPLSLNPIPGGEVRYVPVNQAIVDDNNKVVLQAASGQPQGDQGNAAEDDDEGKPQERSLRVVSSKE